MIRRNQRFLTQLYMVADFLIIQISFLGAWWLKFKSGWLESYNTLPVESYAYWSLIYGVISVFIGIVLSLYLPKRKKRFVDEFLKIFQVHIMAVFILLGLMFFLKEIDVSRQYLAIYMGFNILSIMLYRYVLKTMLKSLREKGFNRQFVLIIGAGSLGKRFYNNLVQYPELGYETIGFLDDFQEWDGIEERRFKPILGKVDELAGMLELLPVDEVILALPLDAHSKYPAIIAACEKAGVRTLIIPDFFDYLPARPYFDNFAGMPMINVRDIPLDMTGNKLAKRLFDIIFRCSQLL